MNKRIVYKNDVYILRDRYTTIRLKTRRVKDQRSLKQSLLKQVTPERIDEYKKYKYSSVSSNGSQYCVIM